MKPSRKRTLERITKETQITLSLSLDGKGDSTVSTGIGFLDHLWASFAKHGRFDLELRCKGDLQVDDHHTNEDCALCVGQLMDELLEERRDLRRFGMAYVPMDETLVRAVVDLSGRPHAEINLRFCRPMIGSLATENVGHALRSLAVASRSTLHVDLIRGTNDHHRAEAAFKAVARAYRDAVIRVRDDGQVPSTKGVL